MRSFNFFTFVQIFLRREKPTCPLNSEFASESRLKNIDDIISGSVGGLKKILCATLCVNLCGVNEHMREKQFVEAGRKPNVDCFSNSFARAI